MEHREVQFNAHMLRKHRIERFKMEAFIDSFQVPAEMWKKND